ncbi:craniofacial development protein 1 [Betta splendens]|uniref:Craniofacial development protein 1 n=1 Tax=Betta splendens TaxID=158456 RepID=A0A6P7MTL5_BETSP|nr:craniofacial development protein 1 [Betta splendens]
MNYSDYDSDGYSSNEDTDYVPSDDNLSEDDINECDKEEPLHEEDSVPHPDSIGRKKRREDTRMRKRKKVEVLDGNLAADTDKTKPPQEAVNKPAVVEVDAEARLQKKSDDLWASFLSDVGSRPKCSASASESSASPIGNSSVLSVSSLRTETKASEPSKVTITKVFDFAGEEVRVDKEVSADSKEAKSYLKSQEKNRDQAEIPSPSKVSLPGPSAKRPAGMSSVLNRIGGKKQRMSTLEKSKMDWDAFKSEEGITEELAIHNRGKEGYVERKNFLERVDHRQFELEKAVRLSNMKQ